MPPAATDDIDDLFDYDAGIDEIIREAQAQTQAENDAADYDARKRPRQDDADDVLGIDEEVTVEKKRKPVAKLDEARLLSQKGIPKLRQIAKTQMKMKGKGHEFTDAARLLNTYQLWLDDLFPKAKFEDGLSIIEKLGHTKRMQVMRKEWIDEGKPRDNIESLDIDDFPATIEQPSSRSGSKDKDAGESGLGTEATSVAAQARSSLFGAGTGPGNSAGDGLFFSDDEAIENETSNAANKGADVAGDDVFDELDELLDQQPQNQSTSRTPNTAAQKQVSTEISDLDDLDALLAEQEATLTTATTQSSKRDEFADDLEAMGDLDDYW